MNRWNSHRKKRKLRLSKVEKLIKMTRLIILRIAVDSYLGITSLMETTRSLKKMKKFRGQLITISASTEKKRF